MSLTFQCGGTGSGKSYRTIENHLVTELVEGKRFIVTNLALKLPELAAYLEKEFPEATVDLSKRLAIIDDDDLAEFFRFRPWGYVVPKVSKEDEKEGKRLDFMHCRREDKSLDLTRDDIPAAFWDPNDPLNPPEVISSKALPGVLYLLDEVHIPFSAQEWQRHGTQILFYLTQRRKFGAFADKIVCMTQYPEQVTKAFRLHCHDWRYTTNHGKVGAAFGIKRPEMLTEMRYLEIKTPRSVPVGMAKFKIDPKGIGNVYHTDGGVGIQGGQGKADTDDRPKGLPWWTLGFVALAGVVLLFYLPEMFGFGIKSVATAGEKTDTVATSAGTAPVYGVGAPLKKSSAPSYADLEERPERDEPLRVVGYGTDEKGGFAWLSDGRTVRLTSSRVSGVDEKGGLIYDGQLLERETRQTLERDRRRQSEGADFSKPQTIAAPSYAQFSQGSALANPGASASRRIRILGFDGKTHAVRTVAKSSDPEIIEQVE